MNFINLEYILHGVITRKPISPFDSSLIVDIDAKFNLKSTNLKLLSITSSVVLFLRLHTMESLLAFAQRRLGHLRCPIHNETPVFSVAGDEVKITTCCEAFRAEITQQIEPINKDYIAARLLDILGS